MTKKWSKIDSKMVQNAPKSSKIGPKWSLGPPWGATVKIIAFFVAAHHPFCGFRLPFGGAWGSHVRQFFDVIFGRFLEHHLETLFDELGPLLGSVLL